MTTATRTRYRVLTPDDPDRYPRSYAVVSDCPDEDGEYYVAAGLTREIADTLALALRIDLPKLAEVHALAKDLARKVDTHDKRCEKWTQVSSLYPIRDAFRRCP